MGVAQFLLWGLAGTGLMLAAANDDDEWPRGEDLSMALSRVHGRSRDLQNQLVTARGMDFKHEMNKKEIGTMFAFAGTNSPAALQQKFWRIMEAHNKVQASEEELKKAQEGQVEQSGRHEDERQALSAWLKTRQGPFPLPHRVQEMNRYREPRPKPYKKSEVAMHKLDLLHRKSRELLYQDKKHGRLINTHTGLPLTETEINAREFERYNRHQSNWRAFKQGGERKLSPDVAHALHADDNGHEELARSHSAVLPLDAESSDYLHTFH